MILSTALVTLGWGTLIWSSSIDTIWPMFGIANQLLAGIALCVGTAWVFQSGRGKWAWITIIPLIFISVTTLKAGEEMIRNRFWGTFINGWNNGNLKDLLQGGLCMLAIVFLLTCFLAVAVAMVSKCVVAVNDRKRGSGSVEGGSP